MGRSYWQAHVPGLVVVVCLVVLVLSASTALALPGDDTDNPVPLTIGVSTPGTLTPQAGLATNHVFVYSVALTAGQTLVATCSAGPTVSPLETRAAGKTPRFIVRARMSTFVSELATRLGVIIETVMTSSALIARKMIIATTTA